MNKINNISQVAVTHAAYYAVLAVSALVVTAVAPVVSLIAVPIFAIKALPKWIEHRSLYNKTLTNLSREKYGRVAGQDYTRWDGKAVDQVRTTADEMHELMGEHVHGAKDDSFWRLLGQEDCPFKTEEDAEWLKHEFSRREKKDLLDSDLRMLRAFLKALLPILGLIWVLLTETGPTGASTIGCRVCMMGGDSENTHWNWRNAIQFHQNNLQRRLHPV